MDCKKSIKLLRGNIRQAPQDIGIGNDCLSMNITVHIDKNLNSEIHQIKYFYIPKDINYRMYRQPIH